MKKLIYIDEKEIQKEITSRNELYDLINEFFSYIENKGIKPNKEYVINFIEQGTPFIHQLLLEDAKKEIKRLKINSSSIQNNMLNGIDRQAEDFALILQKIVRQLSICGIDVKNISFNENQPFNSDADIEEIQERHSVFIRNEIQEKLWNLQSKLAESFNEFEDELQKNNLQSMVAFGNLKYINRYFNTKLDKSKNVAVNENYGFPLNGCTIVEPNPLIHKF